MTRPPDTWSDLPASNNVVYRGAGACGFYKVGGSTGGFTPVPNSELLPGLEECVAEADVPWLSVDPVSATLQPGDSVVVTVSMDANVAQPGTYTASVRIKEDTPYPVDQMDVTMNVTPPNRWGKITGTVESVDCDGVTMPVSVRESPDLPGIHGHGNTAGNIRAPSSPAHWPLGRPQALLRGCPRRRIAMAPTTIPATAGRIAALLHQCWGISVTPSASRAVAHSPPAMPIATSTAATM